MLERESDFRNIFGKASLSYPYLICCYFGENELHLRRLFWKSSSIAWIYIIFWIHKDSFCQILKGLKLFKKFKGNPILIISLALLNISIIPRVVSGCYPEIKNISCFFMIWKKTREVANPHIMLNQNFQNTHTSLESITRWFRYLVPVVFLSIFFIIAFIMFFPFLTMRFLILSTLLKYF